MIQEEINANNCLIVEFMGIKEIQSSYDSYGQQAPIWYAGYLGYRTPAFSVPNKSIEHLLNENKFNNSWDWLMPVVEKIESLGFWTNISAHTSFDNKYKSFAIKRIKPKSDGEYVYNYEGDWNESKIEAVYQGVIEFIKWFNEHQKENM